MLAVISKPEIDNFEMVYTQCFIQNILLFADFEMRFQTVDKFFWYVTNKNQENFDYHHVDDYILVIDYKKKVIEIFNEFEIF